MKLLISGLLATILKPLEKNASLAASFNETDKGFSREHCIVFQYFVERRIVEKTFSYILCYLYLCRQTTLALFNSNGTIALILSDPIH